MEIRWHYVLESTSFCTSMHTNTPFELGEIRSRNSVIREVEA
ncbi:MAG: hypothetical protein ACYSTG_03405 [Planctomycetota bacterium]